MIDTTKCPVAASVWVGYQTAGPDSIQKVGPTELHVFNSEAAAQAWQRKLRVTATGPMRWVKHKLVRGPEAE